MKWIISFVLSAGLLAGPAFAQSVDDGRKVFGKCAGCHKIGSGARNGVGPVLTGVVGRPAGALAGYKYSKAMRAAGAAGLIWTEDEIFKYVENPTAYLRAYLKDPRARAKMAFRLKNETDRRAVAKFLATLTTAAVDNPGHGFCNVNVSRYSRLSAAETRESDRQTLGLITGSQMCASQTAALDGTAPVFDRLKKF